MPRTRSTRNATRCVSTNQTMRPLLTAQHRPTVPCGAPGTIIADGAQLLGRTGADVPGASLEAAATVPDEDFTPYKVTVVFRIGGELDPQHAARDSLPDRRKCAVPLLANVYRDTLDR